MPISLFTCWCNLTKHIPLFFSLMVLASPDVFSDDVLFPVPDIIKDNVALWTRIYTEVGLTEGLLHDREYPGIVYEKISFGSRSPSEQMRYAERRKTEITESLKRIAQLSPDSLTAGEKSYREFFVKANLLDALAGAHERVRFQRGQKERFRLGLERSGRYLDTIRVILQKHGIPLWLAYLPHVESSFDADAYSRVGAAGLWQFMRGTAKSFNMKIDYLIDERRDPILSTEAAAKYLSGSYKKLKTWPLAITSYNHGVAGMQRAVNSLGTNDFETIILKHSSPSFKFASKNFYSCFIAAIEIAENADRYFPDVTMHEKFAATTLQLPFHVKPSVLCSHLGISVDAFRQINQVFRPVVFSQDKYIPAGYSINLPADITASFAEAVLQMIPSVSRRSQPEETEYYTVKRGDNLSRIAAEFRVPVADIVMANNISHHNRIYEGQLLRIPQEPVQTASVLSPEKTAETADVQPQKPPIPSMPPKPAAPDTGGDIVEKPSPPLPVVTLVADSIAKIAAVSALPEPKPDASKKPAVKPAFDSEVYTLHTAKGTGDYFTITVSVNETIGHYADWLGVSATAVRQLNIKGARSDIRIGQKLRMPNKNKERLDRFEHRRLEYHMALEEDFYSQYTVVDVRKRVLKKGESIWAICMGEEQIPLWLFIKYNRVLDVGALKPGMELWMPVIASREAAEGPPEDLPREENGNRPLWMLY